MRLPVAVIPVKNASVVGFQFSGVFVFPDGDAGRVAAFSYGCGLCIAFVGQGDVDGVCHGVKPFV